MYHNEIMINVCEGMVIDNKNFDLLHPSALLKLHPPPPKLWEVIAKNVENQKLLFLELKAVCQER